ncbi:MAG: glycosyltransferase [Pyrobaculum sp.]|jgi:glycosyltransferase involved in cell wall biosynthesis
MKVLAIAELIWPTDSSGGSLATHLHLKRLVQEGAEVTAVGPAAPPGARLIKAEPPTARPALWLWIARRRRWLQKLAEEHDVVYIPRYAYPMVNVAHAAGAPAVVHMHGYPTYKSLGIPGDWKLEKGAAVLYAAVAHAPVEKAVDRWLRRADAVLCVSKVHCQKLAPYRPVYVPNPPPDDLPPPQPPRRYFVYLGGEQRHKCPHLARAAARAAGMPLVEPRDAPRSVVLRLVASAWALLFPSCWEEPMPYAVYEALLMGVPVVAFPIGGQAELISQTPSAQFMAEETSAKAFIQAVMRIVSVESKEMAKLRRDIAEVTQRMWPDKRHLYGLLRLVLR